VSVEPTETARAKHPYAIGPNAKVGASGAYGMRSGGRVVHTNGRRGCADEFLSDGDALVSWDDGTFETVRWNSIRPEDPR
jgi:hypothetical protein